MPDGATLSSGTANRCMMTLAGSGTQGHMEGD